MARALLAAASGHVLSTLPAAGATLTNSAGSKTAGGMENVGTATSSLYTFYILNLSKGITCLSA